MAKPKELEAWGRNKARSRYAEGGDIPPDGAVDRATALDELIKAIARDQMANMAENQREDGNG